MINEDFLIIAEVGQAHDGSLGILHSYIDALADTGVSAVKFQTHIADAESSEYEEFRIPFSYEDKTRFDYWKRMEFTEEQWIEIKSHCEERGLIFISSPFSIAAVDLLDRIDTQIIKIGSGEMTNYLMLDKIASLGKPVILSSGMSSMGEVKEAYERLKKNIEKVSILQCTTMYPTIAEKIGLNMIQEFKNAFPNELVGLSDHSGEIFPSIAAASLGAQVFEFHAVFDKRMFGPDSNSSLSMNQITELVKGLRMVQEMLENPVSKQLDEELSRSKRLFGKSLALSRDLRKGDLIGFNDLESKKPSNMGVDASEYKTVLGKKVKRDIVKNEFLNRIDVE